MPALGNWEVNLVVERQEGLNPFGRICAAFMGVTLIVDQLDTGSHWLCNSTSLSRQKRMSPCMHLCVILLQRAKYHPVSVTLEWQHLLGVVRPLYSWISTPYLSIKVSPPFMVITALESRVLTYWCWKLQGHQSKISTARTHSRQISLMP